VYSLFQPFYKDEMSDKECRQIILKEIKTKLNVSKASVVLKHWEHAWTLAFIVRFIIDQCVLLDQIKRMMNIPPNSTKKEVTLQLRKLGIDGEVDKEGHNLFFCFYVDDVLVYKLYNVLLKKVPLSKKLEYGDIFRDKLVIADIQPKRKKVLVYDKETGKAKVVRRIVK
jgi:hypothetical protein